VLEISTDPADYVNSVWFDIEPTMADAMAMNVRSYLMMHLQKLLRDRGWTQRRAADEEQRDEGRVENGFVVHKGVRLKGVLVAGFGGCGRGSTRQ
jgi:hypothetical protein